MVVSMAAWGVWLFRLTRKACQPWDRMQAQALAAAQLGPRPLQHISHGHSADVGFVAGFAC
eukprot:3206824-Alexandrium_andersonii.AAC.1